jgi:predicted unusual protein kinase regulating ubiquinone biosynthesis (AarF/ABC1/UbiB family)
MSNDRKDFDDKQPEEVPSGHAARIGRLGALGAKIGGRFVTSAMSRLFSSKEKAEQEREDNHTRIAENIVSTLGEMKGLAMKVGQLLSYVDGTVPPEYQGIYRLALSKLQSKSPPLAYTKVREQIAQELGDYPEKLFEGFEETPFAAASIGQVHRARFQGNEVAVKVQYPGIDKAIETELKDAQLIEKAFSPISKRFNAKATLGEIQSRVTEELDYLHEAQIQAHFAKKFAYWDEVVIPQVYPERSSKRILTSQFIKGKSFQEMAEHASQEEKNRIGSTLYRFVFEGFYRFRIFNGDPHPGNYLFLPDGKIAFLDYGCAVTLTHEDVALFKEMHVANYENDIPRATEVMVRLLEVDRTKKAHVDTVKEYSEYLLQPYAKDEPFHYSSEYARGTVTKAANLFRKTFVSTGSVPTTPARFTFLNRLQWGFVSVLALLDARVNCHQLLRDIFAQPAE